MSIWGDFEKKITDFRANETANKVAKNPENPFIDQDELYRQIKKRNEALAYFGQDTNIDPAKMQEEIARQGDITRQKNISAYNAAIASQRGVNPTAAAMSMGQNLSAADAQAGSTTQALQAQTAYQAQLANQQAALAKERGLLDWYGTTEGVRSSERQADTARRAQNFGLIGNLIGGVSGGIAAGLISDESLKQPYHAGHDDFLHTHMMGREEQKKKMSSDGKESVEEFMASLRPQEYEYLPNTAAYDGGKKHLGIMAQDLEKSSSGNSAVIDTPEGKKIDTRQLSAMLAAAVGNLHQRLTSLEGRKNA